MTLAMETKTLIAICGPTAVGKTEYAIRAARALDGEVLSCDSMQLYKYMDIGSAKPTPEERAQVPHHLVDLIDPAEEFSVARYAALAEEALTGIWDRGKIPIVAGGTGLYLNALLYKMDFSAPPGDPALRQEFYDLAKQEGAEALHRRLCVLDPEAAKRIHPNNIKKVVRACEAAMLGNPVKDFATEPVRRTDRRSILLCLTRDREELYDRINQRVDVLMEKGLLGEVQGLLASGLSENDISMKGIGYKEIIGYLEGDYDLAEAVRLIKRNTRHLAKRQLTWFKRYEDMKWLNISEYRDEEESIGEMIRWLEEALRK